MENKYSWEQIEERAKRKEQQIQRLHYSKERQVIKASIFNQAQEWARMEMEFLLRSRTYQIFSPETNNEPATLVLLELEEIYSKHFAEDKLLKELLKKWLKKLYYEYRMWDMEFDNLYFQNIQEKKKGRN